jgi:hypothetical protein
MSGTMTGRRSADDMEFVLFMAEVFSLFIRKQPIISNLLQIKEMLMLN